MCSRKEDKKKNIEPIFTDSSSKISAFINCRILNDDEA